MVQVIDGKRYDTEKAKLICDWDNGLGDTRDFRFREKRLYHTDNGAYFLKHRGGAMTDMAVPCGSGNAQCGSSRIEAITEDDAFGFLQAHSDQDDAIAALDQYFAHRVVDA